MILISIDVIYNGLSSLIHAAPLGMIGVKARNCKRTAGYGGHLHPEDSGGHDLDPPQFEPFHRRLLAVSLGERRDVRSVPAASFAVQTGIAPAKALLCCGGRHLIHSDSLTDKKALASGAFSRFHIRLNK